MVQATDNAALFYFAVQSPKCPWRCTQSTSKHARYRGHNYTQVLFVLYLKVTYLITYLLTPWSRVLLEKQTGLQLVKNFPAFYGTRRFITALTSARHLSLSWASSIQSTHPYTTSWRSILILSSYLHLGLPSGLLPSGFPTKTLYTSPPPYALHAPPISFFFILSPAQYWVRSTDQILRL